MDHVIEETHETRFGNITKKIVFISDSKEYADLEIKKPEYVFRGNSTGSVDYNVRPRTEDDKLGKETYYNPNRPDWMQKKSS